MIMFVWARQVAHNDIALSQVAWASGQLEAFVLLERYGELDTGVVQALGADVFPPVPLHEVQG